MYLICMAQCSKLRVHSAHGAHISMAGRTFLGHVHLSFHTFIIVQCSKLRVHPAPGVHNLVARSTHFDTCAPGGCTFFQSISIHYLGLCTQKNRRVHDVVSLCNLWVHEINFDHFELKYQRSAYNSWAHSLKMPAPEGRKK